MDRAHRLSETMRRNDYDVTDLIRTTDPAEVGSEVVQIFERLYPSASLRTLRLAFEDITGFYGGESGAYLPCDTEYHDIQHVLDVTLAMARLMDGYERSRNGHAPLSAAHFQVGVITALFHDFGYLRRKADRKHRFGAEYTLKHVSRGSAFLRKYLRQARLGRQAKGASMLVHFTGYERDADTIRLADPMMRKVGEMLGTADIIAQMSDRCYLEKCRDRLYPEFVLGGLTRRRLPTGRTQIVFQSGDDLVRKTPGFYLNAVKRLDHQLKSAYTYAEKHFGGENLYMEQMQKNVHYAQMVATDSTAEMLRRMPPSTLLPHVRPYPEELLLR